MRVVAVRHSLRLVVAYSDIVTLEAGYFFRQVPGT